LHSATENGGLADTAWFDETGAALTPEAWSDGAAQLLMLRRAVLDVPRSAVDVTLVLVNGSDADREFALPELTGGWRFEFGSDGAEAREVDATLRVPSRSISLLAGSLPVHADA
jgi:pullulanase/glycogen debranching enzyme